MKEIDLCAFSNELKDLFIKHGVKEIKKAKYADELYIGVFNGSITIIGANFITVKEGD